MAALNQPRNAAAMVAQDIYAESETKVHELGTFFDLGERRFRYCQAGGALARCKATIQAATVANHSDLVTATAAIGATTLTVTLGGTAVTIDQYAGGFVALVAGTGLGQIYRIKSHPAQTTTTGTVVLTLYDPLVIATAVADTKADLVKSKYASLTNSISQTTVTVGVPLIAVTDAYFHWEQTRGLCAVLSKITSVQGTLLGPSTTSGATASLADFVKGFLGLAVGKTHVDGEYNLVDLRCE